MNKKSFRMMRIAMALVLGMAVSNPANAQLGGLMKKAKNAAEKTVKETVNGKNSNNVATDASTDAQTERVMADYEKSHPAVQERKNAERAGGMDKYLGLDQTDNGRILWKYAQMTMDDYGNNSCMKNANSAARQLTYILRYLKGNTEDFPTHKQTAYVLQVVNKDVPESIERSLKKTSQSQPISKADADALTAECARIKQLYVQATGVKEKTAAELKAEADNKYVQDIVNQNYLLNDLTDKNRQAKAVADYKAKVNAKVKAQLAPAKILGTYSTSFAWQGLPIYQMPELKEKYNSVQEMQFKTFYEKGGKYYVVKSAFRQSIPKGDNASGAKPQSDYWPGLETPVEIPADKIQGKF